MTRRTLRRAAAGLFGPVEHFDELPQACLAPSNTSTSCRRLVWACRTLRRAVADYVLPKCVAERGTSYWLLCLTFAPVHSVPPSEESPPLRAEKGNPVKNRAVPATVSLLFTLCRSPHSHYPNLSDGKAPRDTRKTSQETCRMRICITAHLQRCLRQAQAWSCAPAHTLKPSVSDALHLHHSANPHKELAE